MFLNEKDISQQIPAILKCIYSGDFAGAKERISSLDDDEVNRSSLWAFKALSAAMAGEHAEAQRCLAEIADPAALSDTESLVAAGSAWFRLGEFEPAIRFFTAAIERSPDHPLARARIGGALLAAGRIQEALPHLEQAVLLLPTSGGVLLNLAHARFISGDPFAALALLDLADARKDKDARLYRQLRTEVLIRLGRQAEVETSIRWSLEGGEPGAVEALVAFFLAQGKDDEAGSALREGLEQRPDDLSLLIMAAEFSQLRGRFSEANRFLARALTHEPENVELLVRMALFASRSPGDKRGRAAVDKALALTAGESGQARALALAAQASLLHGEGKVREAEDSYKDALRIFPESLPALNGLGQLLMQAGRVAEATMLFERVKILAPVQGWSQLIQARIVPDDPQILEQMALATRRTSLEGPVQSHLLFTLAAAWEKKQDYSMAWSFAVEANRSAQRHLNYSPPHHREMVGREMSRFSQSFMASRKGFGLDSSLPLFIVGMPRSGTTLVEQILGSHSQIFGAGELSLLPELIQKINAWEMKLGTGRIYPEAIDDISREESRRFALLHLQELQSYAPDARRVVDKLPHNFEHIGLIKLLFPRAKILHLKREPRDVAISNYFIDYAAKFGGMGFAYDLCWIGEQLVDHQRLMDHWHQVFPGEIFEVDYDLLVEDVKGWAHQIIDYLELPWEEGVLSFQGLERAVKTASVWQVRQPVYTTSKEKWRRYAESLEPLEKALSEVLPKIEPLPLPSLPPGLFLQGMKDLQGNNLTGAEESFRRLLLRYPEHAGAHQFLGAVFFQMKRFEEASKEMRKSLELHQGHRSWIENHMVVERELGRTEEAEKLAKYLQGRIFAATAGTL